MTNPPTPARRERGLGTITPRTTKAGDARLEAQISTRVDGKRRVLSKWFDDTARGRQQAESWLSITRDAISSGTLDLSKPTKPAADAPVTVGHWVAEWLRIKRTTVKASTHRSYSDLWRLHLESRLGAVVLADLTPRLLTRTYADMAESGTGASTVHAAHRTLRAALTSARRAGLIPANPATDAETPKRARFTASTWTAYQARDFLTKTAESDRLAPLWRFLLLTGVRRGEALGIQWSDLDLTAGAGQVRIHRNLSEVGGKVTRSTAKTDTSVRTLPLDDTTVAALVEWRARLSVESAVAPAWHDHPEVFVDERGHYLIPDRVSKLFGKACKAAGVPRIRLHDMRHSAASLLLAEGVDIKIVSVMLGHSSISVTSSTYAHVTTATTRKASNALGTLLG